MFRIQLLCVWIRQAGMKRMLGSVAQWMMIAMQVPRHRYGVHRNGWMLQWIVQHPSHNYEVHCPSPKYSISIPSMHKSVTPLNTKHFLLFSSSGKEVVSTFEFAAFHGPFLRFFLLWIRIRPILQPPQPLRNTPSLRNPSRRKKRQ